MGWNRFQKRRRDKKYQYGQPTGEESHAQSPTRKTAARRGTHQAQKSRKKGRMVHAYMGDRKIDQRWPFRYKKVIGEGYQSNIIRELNRNSKRKANLTLAQSRSGLKRPNQQLIWGKTKAE